jgi:ABC-type transport system involved in cytochrome bd biosynthesis fused ATPase/permease subunit
MTLKKIARYVLIPAIILLGLGILVMITGSRESAGLFGAPGLFLLSLAIALCVTDLLLDYVVKKFRK